MYICVWRLHGRHDGAQPLLAVLQKNRSRASSRGPSSLAPMAPLSVTGKPVKPSFSLRESNSESVMVGGTQT